ncbi:MAG TPA: hypothetical protein VGK59_19850 [Ohtaekwangia sp.]
MYLFIQLGFALLTVLFFGWLLYELQKGLRLTNFTEQRKKKIMRGTIISLLIWMIITGVLSYSGFLSDFSMFPPRLGIVLIIPLIVIVWVTRTETVREILVHIPQQQIIRIQSFRIFVEILLWMLFLEKLLPVQMSFEGRNFDVLSGLTALIIVWLLNLKKISRTGIIVWNLFGLGLLINIVTIAILSMPTPFRVFMNEPANTIVTEFPIVWLPAFLVPLAYGLHFLSIRKARLTTPETH